MQMITTLGNYVMRLEALDEIYFSEEEEDPLTTHEFTVVLEDAKAFGDVCRAFFMLHPAAWSLAYKQYFGDHNKEQRNLYTNGTAFWDRLIEASRHAPPSSTEEPPCGSTPTDPTQ